MLESDSNSSPIRPFQTLWSNNFSAPATLGGRGGSFKESILAVDALRLMVKMHVAAQDAEDVLQAGYSPASGPSNPFVSLSQPSPSRRSLVWSSLAATWKPRILSSLGLVLSFFQCPLLRRHPHPHGCFPLSSLPDHELCGAQPRLSWNWLNEYPIHIC